MHKISTDLLLVLALNVTLYTISAWNSLMDHVQLKTNATVFKSHLETVLFRRAFLDFSLSLKLDFGFIYLYFSTVQRWSFYASVSLRTTYDVRRGTKMGRNYSSPK